MNVCRWIGAGRFSSVISIAFVALATLAVAGCGSHNRKPSPPVDVPIPPGGPVVPGGRPVVPGGSHPDAMDTSADPAVSSPSILERQTQAYSKSMEAAIAKRQSVKPDAAALPNAQLAAAQSPPSAVPSLAKPSEVQFLDPARGPTFSFPRRSGTGDDQTTRNSADAGRRYFKGGPLPDKRTGRCRRRPTAGSPSRRRARIRKSSGADGNGPAANGCRAP